MNSPLDTRRLYYFLSVAEAGSFTAAAETLGVAQSLLSRQVASLENTLGLSLLERTKTGVVLTESGRLLAERTREILKELNNLREEVTDLAVVPSGSLGIGLPFSLSQVLSTPLIKEYLERFPNVSLRAYEGAAHEIEEWLIDEQIDAGISFGGIRNIRNSVSVALASEEIVVVGKPGSPLRLDCPVDVSDIGEEPIITLRKANFVRLRVEAEFEKYNIRPDVVAEIEGFHLLFEAARQGLGYTFFPRSAVQEDIISGRLAGAPIKSLAVTWTLFLNKRRQSALSVRAFVETLYQMIMGRTIRGLRHVEVSKLLEKDLRTLELLNRQL